MITKVPPYYDNQDPRIYLQRDLYIWMHGVQDSFEDLNVSGLGGITELDDGSGGQALPVNGVVNVVGGSGVVTAASGNTVTISVAKAGFGWVSVTSADNPVQLIAETGYICDGVSQVVFILPLVANLGDSVEIVSHTSTFRINQNGGQQIRIGTHITTAGSGFVTSNSAGDNIELLYVGSNTFMSKSPQGTLTTN